MQSPGITRPQDLSRFDNRIAAILLAFVADYVQMFASRALKVFAAPRYHHSGDFTSCMGRRKLHQERRCMAGCKAFSLDINDDLETLLHRVKLQITNSGGRFEGDTHSGTFYGKVLLIGSFHGQYEIAGNQVIIRITQKPFTISCTAIESKIKDYFR
jgi:hypothetical protein